jgi:protocatechuate 3,4-dioxygenase, beta subunit
MKPLEPFVSRRSILRGGLALGALAFTTPGVFAEELSRTPRLTEGPFYPDRLPLDTDNDLLIVNNSITPAVGDITHLTGRILSRAGEPIRDAVVESQRQQDTNFQGFGRCATGRKGEYFFRTLKPVPYPGRCPHIHVKVKKGGRELLTTQLFINGHPQNRGDGVLRDIRNPLDRELVMVDFQPIADSRIGELQATFDIIIGVTPPEPEHTH